MTTPLNPLDREAWEKRIGHLAVLYRNFAFAEAGLGNSRDSENECWAEYAPEKSRLVDDILATQSQLTEAQAEVERLKSDANNLTDRLTEARAQAGKAEQQNMDIRVACGDMGTRGHESLMAYIRELWHKSIEKARQPK